MLGLQYDDHTSNVKLKQLYSNKKQFEKKKQNKPHTCQQSLYTSTDLLLLLSHFSRVRLCVTP